MSCCASKRLVMSTCAVDAETKSCVSVPMTMPMIDERDQHLAERVATLGGESTSGRRGVPAEAHHARRRDGGGSA